jgi:hypothetical protein
VLGGHLRVRRSPLERFGGFDGVSGPLEQDLARPANQDARGAELLGRHDGRRTCVLGTGATT